MSRNDRANHAKDRAMTLAAMVRDESPDSVACWLRGMKPCHLGNAVMFDDPERVDEARAICKRGCTQLIECRYWALHNDVAGVCGGLTDEERASWREAFGVNLQTVVSVEQMDRDRRDEIIVQMLAGGATAGEVAVRHGISRKSVERVKSERGFVPEEYPQAWRKNGLLHANLGVA